VTLETGIRTQPTAQRPAPASPEAGLERAAREFEAMFVNLLMKSMRETVQMSDLIDNDGEISQYRQMLDEEMSKQLARGPEGLGIAKRIVEQFRQNLPEAETGENRQRLGRALAAYGAPAAVTRSAAAESTAAPGDRPSLVARAAKAGDAVADTLSANEGVIRREAHANGLDPELVLAVIMKESGGRSDAVSRVGAEGLMQLMPETAAELGVEDSLDPAQNIAGGAKYLAWLDERFGGDLELVLAGYNAGPGNVARAGNTVPDFPETRRYVQEVTDLYNRLLGEPDDAPAEETRSGGNRT